MDEQSHRTARLIAVVAATIVSLACGTNYAYSAWGPQFALRMKLSATQSNLIGAAGNMGMYASGIPFGYLVDRHLRFGGFLGGILLGAGYFPIKIAYDKGAGSMSPMTVFFFSFLTGSGSCTAFQAAMKTAAVNWPHHRGTATAFPLSAFGLSALFFTTLSGLAFPADASNLLLFLALGTTCMALTGTVFMRMPRAREYESLAQSEDDAETLRRDSNHLERPSSWQAKHKNTPPIDEPTSPDRQELVPDDHADEESSLLSEPEDATKNPDESAHVHRLDIRGLQLLPHPEFWLIFIMLGILTGIGLMTINNIGNDAQALWTYYDGKTSKEFILRRQLFHVSVISACSFIGRLCSGIGSDFLVKKLKTSRFWCMVAASSLFVVAQVLALSIRNPRFLWLVSSISGLAYGTLFGVCPSLVVDAFGVSGFALNWGVMMLGPVTWGNVLNVVYGRVFDAHSKILENGERLCSEGIACYRDAYLATFAVSLLAVAVSLWSVRHDNKVRKIREEEESRTHLA